MMERDTGQFQRLFWFCGMVSDAEARCHQRTNGQPLGGRHRYRNQFVPWNLRPPRTGGGRDRSGVTAANAVKAAATAVTRRGGGRVMRRYVAMAATAVAVVTVASAPYGSGPQR